MRRISPRATTQETVGKEAEAELLIIPRDFLRPLLLGELSNPIILQKLTRFLTSFGNRGKPDKEIKGAFLSL